MMMFMLVQFWLAIYAGIEFSPKIMRQNRKTRGMNMFFRIRVNLYQAGCKKFPGVQSASSRGPGHLILGSVELYCVRSSGVRRVSGTRGAEGAGGAQQCLCYSSTLSPA